MAKMSQAEVTAIADFERQKEEAAEAQRLAARTIGEVYIDEFNAVIDGEKKAPHIMETLAHLAAFFHDDDPEFRTDNSDPNNCQFDQKGLMGTLCQQADWMKSRAERRMYYLRTEAAKARRAHAQGEIDGLELAEAEIAYGRMKMVQLPIIEDFFTAAKAAYVAQFAEDWTRPVKADTAATTRSLDDRFAHSERRSRL